MTQQFEHLLSPIQIGPIELRNRVLVTGHQPHLAEQSVPGDAYIAYHRERARGGVGLQVTGATPVHLSASHGDSGLLVNFDDRIVPGYRRLAEAVHAEGGRILAQLSHGGGASHATLEPGLPLWSPSPLASEITRSMTRAMSRDDIHEVVAAFGAAAARVVEGGLDGVEIQSAFGLLLVEFLSPRTNRRTDEYGGSLDNRLRFVLEVIDAVRAAVGIERIVGIRIPGDEFVDGGLDETAMREIAVHLEGTGQLDFLNIIAGNNLDRVHRTTHWPPTPAPHGLFVALAAGIKSVVSLPVFAVGRIVDPVHANNIIADGKADMVGMTRAHIADPAIVAKILAGRSEDVRKCVGANVCIGRLVSGRAIRCLHNPEAAREHTWGPALPASRARRVAVIGGGPAGLEAARVAGERGHRVTLYERDAILGGQFALRASIETSREFRAVIDWRREQLRKMQVPIELGHTVQSEDIEPLGADVIVVATGATPITVELPGMDTSPVQVLTAHDVVRDGCPDAGVALVWDHAGGVVGAGVIESLVLQGLRVHVVTPGFAVAEDIDLIQRVPLYERVLSAGTRFIPNTEVIGLEDRDVRVRNVYTLEESRIGPVDVLVPWRGNQVVNPLIPAILAAGTELHTAGDCVAPRTADIAIAEGAMVARRI